MKKLLFIFLFAGAVSALMAQQQHLYTQYMFNKIAVNPAAAGLSGAVCATGFGRSQWMGYKDEQGNKVGPGSYGLTVDMPVYTIKSGVGMVFQYDMIGYERNMTFNLVYAYHRVFSNNSMLSFGLDFGFRNKTIDYTKLTPSEPDPSIDFTQDGSGTITDFGLGVHYRIPRKMYAGFSVSNLLGSSAEIGGPEFKLARHYYLMGGYEFDMEDKNYRSINVSPGFILRATSGAVKVDINAIVTWNDFIWGGVVYRVENAVGVMAGVKYYGFSIGVEYDYTINSTFVEGRSSMEFFVKYCYPIFPGVAKKSGYNTRNL